MLAPADYERSGPVPAGYDLIVLDGVPPRTAARQAYLVFDALPDLPHPMSIARALIEDFVRRHG